MKYWEQPKYQQIVAAHVEMGVLDVEFANGGHGSVLIRDLSEGIDASQAHAITDKDLRVNGHTVKIIYGANAIEVPWDVVRFRSDDSYARAMILLAEIERRKMGALIKKMRVQKGLTVEDLSVRTDYTAVRIEGIEEGTEEAPFSVIRELLAAMGFSLRDLANKNHGK